MLILMALAVPQMLKLNKTRQRDLRRPDHAHHRLGRVRATTRPFPAAASAARSPPSAAIPNPARPPRRPPSSIAVACRHRAKIRLHLYRHLLHQGHRSTIRTSTPPSRSSASPRPSAKPATTATARTRTTSSNRSRRRHQLHPVPSSKSRWTPPLDDGSRPAPPPPPAGTAVSYPLYGQYQPEGPRFGHGSSSWLSCFLLTPVLLHPFSAGNPAVWLIYESRQLSFRSAYGAHHRICRGCYNAAYRQYRLRLGSPPWRDPEIAARPRPRWHS